jgi:hypothetical protein
MMNKNRATILAAAWAAFLAASPAALAAEAGAMFEQGNTHVFLEVGSGTAFNNNYQVFGAGANYFLYDGFSVGLSVESWTGSTPGITKVSPSVQYVFLQAGPVKPYLGAFYRHAFVSGMSAINSAGARAGVYFTPGARMAIGVGMAVESYQNCQASVYGSCRNSYPEISILFRF